MNPKLEYVRHGLHLLILDEKKPGKRAFMEKLLRRFEAGLATLEDELEAERMLSLRNPEFPGDLVGRPDDDFDDGEDES
jgi:hypothetical protein